MRSDGVLPGWLAISLVTSTSAAILVLEILAGRLMAPYVGVNLETYTAIIGTILAGIAFGAWAGGVAADRVDPHRLIPLLLVVGGALAIASIPIVRVLGGASGPGATGTPSVLLAAFGFIPSTSVLSAVPPAVVKLQLRDLAATGSIVGRLSAYGTAGAIAGTFLAGFVLVAYAAVTTLIVATGLTLVAFGVVLWTMWSRRPDGALLSAGGVLVTSLVGVSVIDSPCSEQTAYYCVDIQRDPDRAAGRLLVLDDLRHSYVDLDDPTHLEFWYVQRIAGAIDALAPAGPLDVVSLGGGALTVPRWVRAERPGSEQVVLELDAELVELAESDLGFMPGDDIAVLTGDGRLSMRGLPGDSADVVVGDAFGSRSVPWHLATREFMEDVDRVLRPGGIYVANVIDGPPEGFLRAEAATIRAVFPHVAVLRGPGVVAGRVANSVVVASDHPLDLTSWALDGGRLVADLDAYLTGALVLTDDFAPVDQLILDTR
jgi:spermidine synthase